MNHEIIVALIAGSGVVLAAFITAVIGMSTAIMLRRMDQDRRRDDARWRDDE